MLVSLDSVISIRLTKHGLGALRNHIKQIEVCLPESDDKSSLLPFSRMLEEAEKGELKIPLWQFAHIFGTHLFNGFTPVVEGNEITIEESSVPPISKKVRNRKGEYEMACNHLDYERNGLESTRPGCEKGNFVHGHCPSVCSFYDDGEER